MSRESNLPKFPKGWVCTKLEEVAEIILGQSPPSSAYNENGLGLPFYQGKLEFGDIYPTPRKWCSAPKKIAEKGDVLISVRAPVGPTNICPDKSCIGRGLAAIRGLGGIHTLFMLYLMRAFEHKLSEKVTGTTFDAITGNTLRDFPIPLPPLPEQLRIVAKIEELFTRLEAGVEALKKVRAQLKAYRQAVLKHAFEGKLTEEWRKTHMGELEPASALLERIKEERRRQARGKLKELLPLDTSDLPELPEGWAWTRLGEISSEPQYGWTTSAETHGVLRLLRTTDITPGSIDWSSVPFCKEQPPKKGKYLLQDGDIVISRAGSVGYSCLVRNPVEAVFGSYLIRFKPLTCGEYLSYFLQSPSYWQFISEKSLGIAIPNVNATKLKQVVVPLPPLPEQRRIVEEIERRFSVADQIEKTVGQGLKQAGRLRQSILKRAFEGRLVPQDPTDEPAEKLLERIKAERARIGLEKRRSKRGLTARQGRLM